MDSEIPPFTVLSVAFETVLPLWQSEVWPGRISPIRPVTPMSYLGGYDMAIPERYAAKFFAVYDDLGEIIGVSSGHQTSADHYRCRTMYVKPGYQGRGLARALVQAVVDAAIEAGCDLCWGLPRAGEMVEFFRSQGWVAVSEPIEDGMEFGPNVYMAITGLRPVIKKTRKRRKARPTPLSGDSVA